MIFSLSLVNARSVINKVESLQQHILERQLDMCAIMEMWIKSLDEKNVTKEIPTTRLLHILISEAIWQTRGMFSPNLQG